MQRITSLVGLSLACSLAWAQAPTSLRQAFDAAWLRQPAALAQAPRQALAGAEHDLARAWTPGPPKLGLSTVRGRPGPSNGQQEWEVELATPLWLPGQRDARAGLAQARGGSLAAATEAARVELAGRLREAWWALAQAHQTLAQADGRVELAQALHADVTRRWRAGELARVEALEAQAELQAARMEALEARSELAAARSGWKALTGLAEPANFDAEPAATTVSLAEHPRWRAAEAEAEIARARLTLAERSPREAPELALRWVRERGASGEPYGQVLGLQLSLPFSSGPRAAADGAEARAELAAAQARADLLRDELALELDRARQALEAASGRLELATVRAAAAQEVERLWRKAFELGQIELATLLRARAEARAAAAEVDRATLARAAAVSKINQSMGVLP